MNFRQKRPEKAASGVEDVDEETKDKKRKEEDLPEGGKDQPTKRPKLTEDDEVKDTLENLEEWRTMAEDSCRKAGNLAKLKERIEKERRIIIHLMEEKRKEAMKMEYWQEWWEMMEKDEKATERNRRLQRAAAERNKFKNITEPNLQLKDWRSWWKLAEDSCLREGREKAREDKLRKAAALSRKFKERIQPDLLLSGWGTWWNRMENQVHKSSFISRYYKTITENIRQSSGEAGQAHPVEGQPPGGQAHQRVEQRQHPSPKHQRLILTPKRRTQNSTVPNTELTPIRTLKESELTSSIKSTPKRKHFSDTLTGNNGQVDKKIRTIVTFSALNPNVKIFEILEIIV